MHFFNPAPVQRLVELVGTVVTEPDIIDDLKAFAATLDKVPVVIGDRAGFIANALLFGYLNHAARMYEQRYATREDLDAAMRFGCGYPMGPLALLDLIGLDTAYEILETMYAESRNLLHAPTPILKHMITAGLQGRKSGRGFYTYAGPHSSKVVPDAETPTGTVPDRRRRCATSSASAWSAPARWRRASSRCSRKPGLDVVVRGRSESKVAAALAGLRKALDKGVVRGRLTEDERDAAVARVTGTTRLEDLGDVDLVVEAVVEELDVKRAVFAALDEVCKPGAILATTTSSLPVVECAVATARPADVIGHALLQPGAGDEAGRGGLDGHDLAGRRGHRARVVRSGSTRCRCAAATARASSSTRCCSRTSTTR